jgi:hypothetical protein
MTTRRGFLGGTGLGALGLFFAPRAGAALVPVSAEAGRVLPFEEGHYSGGLIVGKQRDDFLGDPIKFWHDELMESYLDSLSWLKSKGLHPVRTRPTFFTTPVSGPYAAKAGAGSVQLWWKNRFVREA